MPSRFWFPHFNYFTFNLLESPMKISRRSWLAHVTVAAVAAASW